MYVLSCLEKTARMHLRQATQLSLLPVSLSLKSCRQEMHRMRRGKRSMACMHSSWLILFSLLNHAFYSYCFPNAFLSISTCVCSLTLIQGCCKPLLRLSEQHPVLLLFRWPSSVWRKTWESTRESPDSFYPSVQPSTWMVQHCMRLLRPFSLHKWTESSSTSGKSSSSVWRRQQLRLEQHPFLQLD